MSYKLKLAFMALLLIVIGVLTDQVYQAVVELDRHALPIVSTSCNTQVATPIPDPAPEATKAPEAVKKQDPALKLDEAPNIIKDPFADIKFTQKAVRYRPIAAIRSDDFGAAERHLPLTIYKGEKKRLEEDTLRKTIKAVVLRFPNLRHTKDLQDLLFETMLVESNLLGISRKQLEMYNNFGIAQFRVDTAKDTLGWLKHIRKDVYDVIMDLYVKELSLKDNLRYNIPFAIGMMAQYYWRIAPDLYPNITTLEKRGILWKSAYNTAKGLGTVNAYKNRVKKYYRNKSNSVASADSKRI